MTENPELKMQLCRDDLDWVGCTIQSLNAGHFPLRRASMKSTGDVGGRMERRTDIESWGECQRGEGTQDTWMYSKANKRTGKKSGNWDPSTRLESGSLPSRLGKMQLLQSGPVHTCLEWEGGRQISQNAKQPASDQPQPVGKGVCLGTGTLGI